MNKYYITFPEAFRPAFITFVEGEIEKVRADHEADTERNHRPNDYLQWAEPFLERLRSAEGDFVALDEADMNTLRRDLVPTFVEKTSTSIFYTIEIHFHDHVLQELLQEQSAAAKLLVRLHRFHDRDLFDPNFKGDRPEDQVAPAA